MSRKCCATFRTKASTWFARRLLTGDGPCGLRDYGTGLWGGGDPDCDHIKGLARNDGNRRATWGQFGDGEQVTGHEGGTVQFKDVCGKCGATRVDQQLGLEATPEQYVANMVEVFREVRRVLRRDGTCWINLGDSYVSQGGPQVPQTKSHRGSGLHGANRNPDTWTEAEYEEYDRAHQDLLENPPPPSRFKTKDLVGVPWRVAFALQADGWYLRSDIIWSKPNPMPESVTDRPTKAHEYVFLLTRSPRYFFDADAVREAAQPRPQPDADAKTISPNGDTPWLNNRYAPGASGYGHNPAGRNIRSVWEIATQPYAAAHFATFPEALPERCIKAGTSERGCCPVCGAPWERSVAVGDPEVDPRVWSGKGVRAYDDSIRGMRDLDGTKSTLKHTRSRETTDWQPSCDHYYHTAPAVPCTVLDPFMGSGTTALVARRLGRRSIGVELSPEYAAICAKRLQQLSLFAGATDG
jgi:DNA modification methylase